MENVKWLKEVVENTKANIEKELQKYRDEFKKIFELDRDDWDLYEEYTSALTPPLHIHTVLDLTKYGIGAELHFYNYDFILVEGGYKQFDLFHDDYPDKDEIIEENADMVSYIQLDVCLKLFKHLFLDRMDLFEGDEICAYILKKDDEVYVCMTLYPHSNRWTTIYNILIKNR